MITKTRLILTIFILLLTSCDKPLEQLDPRMVKDSMKELEETFQLSKDEIQKLKQLDYKVLSVQNSKSDKQLEMILSELGKERWDCFNVVAVAGDTLRIFCRRPTHTPLRYVPGSLRNSFGG